MIICFEWFLDILVVMPEQHATIFLGYNTCCLSGGTVGPIPVIFKNRYEIEKPFISRLCFTAVARYYQVRFRKIWYT